MIYVFNQLESIQKRQSLSRIKLLHLQTEQRKKSSLMNHR